MNLSVCLFVCLLVGVVQWKPLLQRRKCQIQRYGPVLGNSQQEQRLQGVSGKFLLSSCAERRFFKDVPDVGSCIILGFLAATGLF